ncbi:MAG: FtsQ-type POTRA domain-containing protein [Clostridia bacterium]
MKKRLAVIAIGLILVVTAVVFGRLFLVRTIEESYAAKPINVVAGEVLSLSGIEQGKSILGINEERVIRKVAAAYPDNSVVVTGVERVFPNKVIIHIKERVPIAAIVTKGNPVRYALADMDFQYNKIVSDSEIEGYIYISGVEVDATFNTAIFAAVRQIFQAFIQLGTPDYALPALISEVACYKESYTVILRSGATLSIDKNVNDIIAEITAIYLLI